MSQKRQSEFFISLQRKKRKTNDNNNAPSTSFNVENKNTPLDATIIPDSSEVISTSGFDVELAFEKKSFLIIKIYK